MSFLSSCFHLARNSNSAVRRLPILLLTLLAGSLLSSCSSGLYPLDPPALQARGLQPGEGYIVATLDTEAVNHKGEPATRGAMALLLVRGSGTAKGAYPTLVPYGRPSGQASKEIAIPVPAGDYEITGWSMSGAGSSGPVTVANRKPIKVPFQVQPGEATYVGSYHSTAFIGRNLLGFPIFARGIITAEDKFSTDQAAIAKKYPSIKKDRIRRSDAAKTYMSEMKRISEKSGFLGLF